MLLVIVLDLIFLAALAIGLVLFLFLPWFKFRQAAFAVFKRNFVGYFSNPTGYVFLCLFVLLTSLAAFWPHEFFASNLANLDQLNLYLPYIMLLFIPAITMSVWADESRQGTDELLLTLPATDYEIVIGKYFAVVGIYTVSLVFSQLWNICVLAALTGAQIDTGLILTTYLGYWMIGLAMLALGMVASFFTRNLTVAFVFGVLFNAPLVFLADIDVLLTTSTFLNQVQEWSFLHQLNIFGRGIIGLVPCLYLIGIATTGVFISLILIGRRHVLGSPDGSRKMLNYIIQAACIAVMTVSIPLVAKQTSLNRNFRTDLSEGKISSLSSNTEEILNNLFSRDESNSRPIVIDAYISDNIPPAYISTKNQLVNLLREFDARGGSRITVNLFQGINPSSEEAVTARKSFDIPAVPVRTTTRGSQRTERVIMGASFRSGLDQVTVPFFHYGMPVEYELIRSMNTVAKSSRKTVGIVRSDALMMGGRVFTGQRTVRLGKRRIVQELAQQYNVEEIDASSPIPVWIDGEEGKEKLRFDAMIVVQPSSLTPQQLTNVVEAIERGQPTAIFEDPFPAFIQTCRGTSEPRPQVSGSTVLQKAEIRSLWKTLGIDVYVGRDRIGRAQPFIVWQSYNPYPQRQEDFGLPEFVFLRNKEDLADADQVLSQDSPISRGIEELLLPFPGAIQSSNNEDDVEMVPILRTEKAGVIRYDEFKQFERNPGKLEEKRGNPESRFVLAGRIFSKSDLGPPSKAEKDKINCVYVADCDMLFKYFVDIRNQPVQEDVYYRFMNTTFFLNMVDSLAGEDEYIAIRTRQKSNKTLASN